MPCIGWILFIAWVIFMAVVIWRIFTKAGRSGWKALIPVYNVYVSLNITGRPGWWLILFFIPIVNIAVSVIHALELGRVFGRRWGFRVGLVLLPFIFLPIMAFDSSKYEALANSHR